MQSFALFAADAVSEPTIMGYVWQGLFALAGTVLTVVLAVAGSAIRAKAKDGRFGALISQLWVIVQAAVAHAEAELRPKFQKALEDGVLTPEEGAALKAEVMKVLRDTAASQLQALVKSFGLPEGAISTLLSGLVERAVSLLKVSAEPVPVAPLAPVAPSDTRPTPVPQ
jgi:hypothetical protein